MPWTVRRLLLTLTACLLAWLAVAAICVMIGSGSGGVWPADPYVRAYRFEIVLLASLVGAALASAGTVYQSLLRNPLADPYLLGVSSGAALAAYVWRLGGLGGSLSSQAAAFIGATAAVVVVFAAAGRRLEPLTLLLLGVIVNAFNASAYLLLDAIFRNLPGVDPLQFIVGGLQANLSAGPLVLAAILIGLSWLMLMLIVGPINAASLSDVEAHSLGVSVQTLRWTGLIAASLMTAAAVAVSGPIGFVGLICPHLARLIVGSDVRRLLPVSTALGAALLALADAGTRKPLRHFGANARACGRVYQPAWRAVLSARLLSLAAERAMNLLDASEVSVAIDAREILANISLTLRPGEIVSLLGPNGSGKTTLLSALIGERSASGSIAWNGHAVASLKPAERAKLVSLLPQSPTVQADATVRESIALGRSANLGWFGIESSNDSHIVESILSDLELIELRDRRMQSLSGGQRQRVLIGRSLAQQAAALLLDEPDTFLDLRQQQSLGRLLKELARRRNIGIIVASHDLNFALRLADRFVLLKQGRCIAAGAMEGLSEQMLALAFDVSMVRAHQFAAEQ